MGKVFGARRGFVALGGASGAAAVNGVVPVDIFGLT